MTREAAALSRLDDIAQAYLCRREVARLKADGHRPTSAPSVHPMFAPWTGTPTAEPKSGAWKSITEAAKHYGVWRKVIYRWIGLGVVASKQTPTSGERPRMLVWCEEPTRPPKRVCNTFAESFAMRSVG